MADTTARFALALSTGIEDLRRRLTVRMMRGAFRVGGASDARLPRTGFIEC